MENKKIWIITIAVILIILILGLGIYFFNKYNAKGIAEKKQQNVSGNLANLSFQPILSPGMMLNPPYNSIDSLNKSGCLEIKEEYFKSLCINGTSLIEKATSVNNLSLCFDKSIGVNTRIRTMCLQKFSEIKVKENNPTG